MREMFEASFNSAAYRTNAIANDDTHPAQDSAKKAIKAWNACKEAARAGHAALLCEPVLTTILLRNSVRRRDMLQQRYDRGFDF